MMLSDRHEDKNNSKHDKRNRKTDNKQKGTNLIGLVVLRLLLIMYPFTALYTVMYGYSYMQ